MNRRGFTLLELTISISLMFSILGAAYAMLSLGFQINRQIVMEKEMIEIGEQLQSFLTTEFSRASSIEAVLDKSGKVHYSVGSEPLDIQSIKLIRSKFISYQKPYREALIFLKDYEKDYRHSIWLIRESRDYVNLDVISSQAGKAFEIGTQVKGIQIEHIDQNIYRIEMTLTYFDTGIDRSKSFFVRLQN